MTKKQALNELDYIESFINRALQLSNDPEEGTFSAYVRDLRAYIKRTEDGIDDEKR